VLLVCEHSATKAAKHSTTNDWDTATWSSNFSGGNITIVNALAIYNFLEEDLNNATILFSVNGGVKQPLSGWGFNFQTNTVNISTEDVPDPDPTTVTQIEFFYTFSSSIGIDYDDSVLISARGSINARIRSERDVRIQADQDIRLEAEEEIRIDGNDRFRLRNNSTTRPIQIITDNDNIAHTWSFESDGRLIFPDNTDQTTAYVANNVVQVSHIGAFSDDTRIYTAGVYQFKTTTGNLQIRLIAPAGVIQSAQVSTVENINGTVSGNVTGLLTLDDSTWVTINGTPTAGASDTVVATVVSPQDGKMYRVTMFRGSVGDVHMVAIETLRG
jgi:hypothetical protein